MNKFFMSLLVLALLPWVVFCEKAQSEQVRLESGVSEKQKNDDNWIEWKYFIGNIDCKMFVAETSLPFGSPIKINVEIKYTGDKKGVMAWDVNFVRLLWQQSFVLISDSGKNIQETSHVTGMTGGMFGPRQKIEITNGIKLTSTLDCSDYPGSLIANIFRHEDNFHIKLYGQRSPGDLVLLGNDLTVNIDPAGKRYFIKQPFYVQDGMIVANIMSKCASIPSQKINSVNKNMSIRELVDKLGPGCLHPLSSIGEASWHFDNGKALHVWLNSNIDQPATRYFWDDKKRS